MGHGTLIVGVQGVCPPWQNMAGQPPFLEGTECRLRLRSGCEQTTTEWEVCANQHQAVIHMMIFGQSETTDFNALEEAP